MIKIVELNFRAQHGTVNVDTRIDVGTETQPEWICVNHESIPICKGKECPAYWGDSQFCKYCGGF